MNDAQPITVALLRASAQGYAGLATARLSETESESGRPLTDGFEKWKAYFHTLVLQLAAAVEAELPEQFAERVVWSRDAFVARGLEADVLRAALGCLQAALVESVSAASIATLSPYFQCAGQALASGPQPAAAEAADDCSRLANDYLSTLLAGDERAAGAVVFTAIDAGRVTLHQVLERVLAPAQQELGRRWHLGQVNVAEEHFATTSTIRLLACLMARSAPVARSDRTVIVSGVSGDDHEFGVLLVAAFFELDGWHTICLGSNTPAEDLAKLAVRFDADLVALGATLDVQREEAARAISAVRAARKDVPVIVGGAAFAGSEALWRRAGADAYAGAPAEAVRIARGLVAG